jgi:hypothetical protein
MVLHRILILDWAWTYVGVIAINFVVFFFDWVLDRLIQWSIFDRERSSYVAFGRLLVLALRFLAYAVGIARSSNKT